jgi:predicted ATP-dependent Lon-type protease
MVNLSKIIDDIINDIRQKDQIFGNLYDKIEQVLSLLVKDSEGYELTELLAVARIIDRLMMILHTPLDQHTRSWKIIASYAILELRRGYVDEDQIAPNEKVDKTYICTLEGIAEEIKTTLIEKNQYYGPVYENIGSILEIMTNDLNKIDMTEFLAITRIVDKLMRITHTTRTSHYDAWKDILGYALLELGILEKGE